MMYQVVVAPAVNKVIAGLPQDVRKRIALRLVALQSNPRPPGCIKLTGEDAYRIRVGDYRVIYTVDDGRLIVVVIDSGHRREIYRKK